MTFHSGRTLRAPTACAALFLVALVTPAIQPSTLQASAALYHVTDLGALNCCYDSIYASAALALNAHGDVAGFTASPIDASRTVPFVYQNGTMTAISDGYGWATSINDAGEVTGFVLLPGQTDVHAFRYRNGVFTDAGTLPGFSSGEGFVLVGQSTVELSTVDHPEFAATLPMATNAARQVVGYAWRNGTSEERAFLYRNGVMTDLGTLENPTYVGRHFSAAHAINNFGHVVGISDASVFLYRDGIMIDLNKAIERDTSGVWPHISSVRGINDAGQIAGSCYMNGAKGVTERACLLTPVVSHP